MRFSAFFPAPVPLSRAREFWPGVLESGICREPIDGSVELTLGFTLPWRARDGRRARAIERIPSYRGPGVATLAKTVEDALAALRFVHGGRPVCRLMAEKWIGERPGLSVTLEGMAGELPLAQPFAPPAGLRFVG